MIASHVIALLVATFAVGCLGTPDHWLLSGGSSYRMCTGVNETCHSVQSCTYHAYGACSGMGQPKIYIEGQVQGIALIKDQITYLTDSNQVEVWDPSNVAHNGYGQLEESKTQPKRALWQAGAFYGSDPRTSGMFIGMSSYTTQTGPIATKETNVFAPSVGQARASVTSKTVCTSELTSGACGAKRTLQLGEYQFSLFGRTLGSNFNVAADVTHLGIRTKMSIVGTELSLTVNDGQAVDNIGATDVTKLTLTETSPVKRKLTVDFPTKYNTGDTTGTGLETPSATNNVKIKVSRVSGEALSFYIDYLFDVITVNDKYFIYTATATATSTANKMSLLFPLVIAFAASLLRLCDNQAA